MDFNPTRHFLVTSSGIVPQVPTSLNTGFVGASVAWKSHGEKKQTERKVQPIIYLWCDPWGKFWQKKMKLPPSNSCCPQSETLLWHYHFPCPWAHRNAELPCVLDRVEKVNPGWWDAFYFFWRFKDYQLLLNNDARIHLLIHLQDFMLIMDHDSWRP